MTIEWQLNRSSLLSPAMVESRLASIAALPEHPERAQLEMLRTLAEKPEVFDCRVEFAGRDWWLFSRRTVANGTELRSGGTPDRRWQVYHRADGTGQLTVIGEGMPAPAGYNLSRRLDEVEQGLLEWLRWGLPEGLEVAAAKGEGTGGWMMDLRRTGASMLYRLRGRVVDNHVRPDVVERWDAEGVGKDGPQEVWRFEGQIQTPWGSVPARISHDRSDEVREKLTLVRAVVADLSTLRAGAHVPTVEPSVKVVDFTSPTPEVNVHYEGASSMVWTRRSGRDEYSITPSPVIPPAASSRWMLWASAGGALVVLGVAAWRWKRSNRVVT